MSKRKHRTRLFIARRFQIRYVASILIIVFLSAVLGGYTVYVTSWLMLGEKLAVVYPQGILKTIIDRVNSVLLLRLFLISPFVVLLGLFFSNRIAGPLFRIKRYLRKIALGHYENTLKIREKDELHDLASEINHMVAKLRADKEFLSDRVLSLEDEISGIEKDIVPGTRVPDDIPARIGELRKNINMLKGIPDIHGR